MVPNELPASIERIRSRELTTTLLAWLYLVLAVGCGSSDSPAARERGASAHSSAAGAIGADITAGAGRTSAPSNDGHGGSRSAGYAGNSSGLRSLDLHALDPALLRVPLPNGLDSARERAQARAALLSTAEKLALVQGTYGQYVGNIPAESGLPALTLQDGPAGVARFTDVTAFPAPIALAATWDRDLVQRWGAAMGEEMRGKGVVVQLGPMMNLVRTPQAGRNSEGFGEDPYLAAELAAADVRGIQSRRVVATVKHFVGNEQETNRNGGNSQIDERTLHEIYYVPFEASVGAGAGAAMCSYNRVNGVYACEDPAILGDLKQGIGFSGWIMSDWEATHSTAQAANAGLDMEMPSGLFFSSLGDAIADGLVPASRLDDMVVRILTSLQWVGVLDDSPSGDPNTVVSSEEHTALARAAATAGITLLKNVGRLLPLSPNARSIAVIGRAAQSSPYAVGSGSANVKTPYIVTPLEAIRAVASNGAKVTYTEGDDGSEEGPRLAAAAAAAADVAVVVVAVPSSEAMDRPSLSLTDDEEAMISAVAAANPNTVVALDTPGAVLMPWIEQVGAVVIAWYPGQENGHALASVLFGEQEPSGRLPVSFPRAAQDLPTPNGSPDVPYSEKLEIGYRHLDAMGTDPLFPFGFGLGYTTFTYGAMELTPSANPGAIDVWFDLTNDGPRAGTEIVQLYLSYPAAAGEPPRVLRGFERVTLGAGKTQRVRIELLPRAFRCWSSTTHRWYIPTGNFQISIGGSSRHLPLSNMIEVAGTAP